MTTAVVGVEITVDRMEGKWKVSQNRAETDRQSVIAALDALDTHAGRGMAELMRNRKSES
jgi:transcriptional regulator